MTKMQTDNMIPICLPCYAGDTKVSLYRNESTFLGFLYILTLLMKDMPVYNIHGIRQILFFL